MASLIPVGVAAYLIGSISFAVIVCRAFGLPDPRSFGSGNPGATNVLRSGKKAAAVLTLIGDGVKGWVAVFLAELSAGPGEAAMPMAVAGVAVIVGHMYPVFFRFQGGKGVSTALGVLVGLNVYLAGGALATWLVILGFFRFSSLAALVSAAFTPFGAAMLFGINHPYFYCALTFCSLLVWRHRGNMRKLIAGTEDRVGSRGASPQSAASDPGESGKSGG